MTPGESVPMTAIFDDFGVRFTYPRDWELDVSEDGTRATIALQAPDSMAFAFIALDSSRPAAQELVDEALDAMRAEYPSLEAVSVSESIDGHKALGHDAEFMTFDMINSCAIRGIRTARRSVLFFAQWSQLDDDQVEAQVRDIRASFAETDA